MSDTTVTRIGELEQKLAPLAKKQSGMPIEADDWNALVSTVLSILGIDRIQEDSTRATLTDRFALKEHQHLGAVTIDWLDDDLRTRMGGGGTAVALQQTIDNLQKRVGELSAEVKRLQTTHGQLQQTIDTFSVNDTDRGKAVRTLTDRVDKLGDLGRQVQGLGRDFTTLQAGVTDVRELRKKLLDEAGAPIDFVGIRNDVRALQVLGENLNGVDGKPIRLRDIELQLREVKDVSGVGDGLQVHFTNFAAEVKKDVLTTVTAQVSAASETLFSQQKDQISLGVKSAVDAASAAQATAVKGLLTESEGRLTTSLSTTLLKTIRDEQTPRFKTMEDKLAQVDPRITAAVNALKPELTAAVENTVRPKITTELQAVINRATTDLGTRATATEALVADLKNTLPAKVAGEVEAETRDLGVKLGDQVKQQVDAARGSILGTVAPAVDRATGAALATLDQRIGTAVATVVGDLPKRVRDEVGTQTRNLPLDVQHEVAGQLGAVNIPEQIKEATKGVPDQVLGIVNTRFTAERAQTGNDIAAAKTDLQRQIIAEVANGKNGAVAEAKVLVEGLRVETKKNFDVVNTKLPRTVVLNPGIATRVNP